MAPYQYASAQRGIPNLFSFDPNLGRCEPRSRKNKKDEALYALCEQLDDGENLAACTGSINMAAAEAAEAKDKEACQYWCLMRLHLEWARIWEAERYPLAMWASNVLQKGSGWEWTQRQNYELARQQ